MHYYPFHIGDYKLDTGHLDDAHDLAYRRLIDLYYLSEKPIPLGTQQVSHRLGLGLEVVEDVLKEFFSEREDGWHQARCDSEIMKFNAKAAVSRLNGQKGGKRKKAKSNPAGTHQVPSSIPTGTQQPPTLVMGNGSSLTLNSELEEPLPAGFPKTEGQAIQMAQQSGCPAPDAYLIEVWGQASGRGGRDGANVPIRHWGSHVKMRWSREEMEWTVKKRKISTSQESAKFVEADDDGPSLWEQIQARERAENEEHDRIVREAGL